jgi:hypothetical protein
MLKFHYIGEPYNYGVAGSQNYKVDAEIELNDEASTTDAVEAFVEIMKIATYAPENIVAALKEVADNLEQ